MARALFEGGGLAGLDAAGHARLEDLAQRFGGRLNLYDAMSLAGTDRCNTFQVNFSCNACFISHLLEPRNTMQQSTSVASFRVKT